VEVVLNQQCLLRLNTNYAVSMEFWTKLALFIGLLLIVSPLVLRMYDFIDNSTTMPFFVIGVVLVVIGERNRVRLDENRVSSD
jgi:uncharacterized membrane protein